MGHSDERKHLYSATFGSSVDREVERSMSRQTVQVLNDILRTAADDTVQQTIYYRNLESQLKRAGFNKMAGEVDKLQKTAAANILKLRDISERLRSGRE